MNDCYHLTPPLRGLRWNGHTLAVDVDPGTALELWLDGAKFCAWPARDDGHHTQSFAFAPGGYPQMGFEIRYHGLPLHAPLGAEWGTPGLFAGTPQPAPLAPLDAIAEQRFDVAAGAGGDRSPKLTIVVPVYNAAAAVARCLASLREHTLRPARLILIDDASTDPAVTPLLAMAAAWPNVELLRNDQNLGFTRTVNRGLELAAGGDVVLLNADTEVGPLWLAGLRRAAYADAATASATAVSDDAGAFSVPELERANPLPAGWNHVDAARALLHDAGLVLPRLPTGNGFCMYLRGDALARVGLLDGDAFPRGYGEENDWSQRAERLGLNHVIAGNVFVHHARSQSFGEDQRRELGAAGMQVLRQRYPGYEAAVGAQLYSWPRLVLDWRVRRRWAHACVAPRPRVLLGVAGRTAPWSGWEGWRLQPEADRVRLLDAAGSERENAPLAGAQTALAAWLQRYGFEAADLDGDHSAVATALGVPVVSRGDQIPRAFRAD